MRTTHHRRVVAGCIVLGIAAAQACREPTQVILEIDVDIPCSAIRGVEIVVAGNPNASENRAKTPRFASTSTRACEANAAGGGRIGTLVVTPSGDHAAVIVIAGLGDTAASSCGPPLYKGCVVARRSFAFIEHVTLRLPIHLDPACVDVPCNVESTCAGRQCVRSDVTCSESGECSAPGVGPNGTPDIVDAGPIPDGPSDDAGDAAVAPDADAAMPPPEAGASAMCPDKVQCPLEQSTVACDYKGTGQRCCYSGGVPMCAPACVGLIACCNEKADCSSDRNCCASGPAGAGTVVFCGNAAECQPGGPIYICKTPGSTNECPNSRPCGTPDFGPPGFHACQ
jgi:hypothetical protein